MTDDYPRGRFCWFDLMTTDPQAAVAFYTELIGWGTEQWDGGGQPYTMWTNNGTSLGGVMPLPAEASEAGTPPHWIASVAVPDVDATAEQVEASGGTILHPPTDIPTVGRYTVFQDPQGVAISAFTAKEKVPGHDGPAEVGEFSWHELLTTDYEAGLDFYQALFGWEKMDAMDMGPAGIYQMYGRGGLPLGGMFNKTADMPGPPYWLYYIRVEDVHTAVEKAKSLGATLLHGPMEVPGGDHIAQLTDPQGGAFAIHHKTDS